jgi:putative two-component system response regulator
MNRAEPANNNRTTLARVLIVDDEPTLRRLMRRALSGMGLDVVEASNGKEALELLHGHDFSAVVSDVRMPVMGGIELVEQLQRLAPDVPVVLVSGSDEVSSRAGAKVLGAFDFLAKPFDLFDLGCRVLSAVAAHPAKAHRRQVA